MDEDNGPVLHSLGLLETRSGEGDLALEYLGKAADVEVQGTRHRFVYGIALHDMGKPNEAIAELQKLVRAVPGNEDALLALANYSAELGLREQAARYAKTLTQIAPGNQAYQKLYQSLQGN